MRLGYGRIWIDRVSLKVFVSDVGHEFRKGDHFEISVKSGISDEPGGVGNAAENFSSSWIFLFGARVDHVEQQ